MLWFIFIYFISDSNVPGAEYPNEEDDIDEAEDFSDKPEVELGPGVYRVKTVDGVQSILDSNNPVLVFMEQLKALAKTNLHSCVVGDCGLDLQVTTESVASAVYLKWVNHFTYYLIAIIIPILS